MGTYQVQWLQRFHLQQVRNVFYYVTTVGEPSDGEWVDIADEIRADILASGMTRFVPEWAYFGINARRVDSAGLLTKEFSPTLGDLVGTSGSDSTSTQIAVLVSVKGTTTKPNRARSYLCGFNEDVITNSLVNLTDRTALETLIDLQSDLNTGGTNPLQRVAAQWNASHTFVSVTNDISGAASKASQVPATQRRRRIGVGI